MSNSLAPTAIDETAMDDSPDRSPILIVPYMWIGDFVRCHTVIQLLRARFPDRPVDMLTTTLCAPLTDYMPGLRRAITVDLPRNSLALAQQKTLADHLKQERYGTALIMPRTWKAALAPFFAGIPERTGFVGEARFFLLNDLRFGERGLPRMVDPVEPFACLIHACHDVVVVHPTPPRTRVGLGFRPADGAPPRSRARR